MNGIENYAAFYKMSGTSSLISSMMGGGNSSSGISSLGQIGNLAQANDARLAIIMNSRSNSGQQTNSTIGTKGTQTYQSYKKEAAEFSKQLNSVVDNLKSSAQKLQQYGDNALNTSGYGSKNSSVVSVTSDSTANTADSKAIDFSVSSVAKAQNTQSASFVSNGKSLGGSSSITLYNADKSKSEKLSFNFSYSTTNKDALSQMASKINESKMGVTASVVEKDGRSSLSIVSDKTGTDAGFSAVVSGSVASRLDLTNAVDAQNATYTENGFTKTSQSNDIKLADGKVSATIKGLGSTSIEKNVKDTGSFVDAAKKFASDYNDALDLFAKYSNRSPSMKSMASAFSSTKYSSTKLSEIGINVSASGRLSVDSTKLSSALSKTPQKVNDILSGKDGLASTAYQKASAAKINERNLFPPTTQQDSAFSPAAYNKNLNFVTTYLSGTFLNSMI